MDSFVAHFFRHDFRRVTKLFHTHTVNKMLPVLSLCDADDGFSGYVQPSSHAHLDFKVIICKKQKQERDLLAFLSDGKIGETCRNLDIT